MDAPEDFLRVECEVSGGGRSVRLRLDGEVDLSTARDALEDRGGEVVIVDVNAQLRRLFEISGLTTAFTFEP